MKRRLGLTAVGLLVLMSTVSGFGAASAQAAFGINKFTFGFFNKDGTVATQAGSHAYAIKTQAVFNSSFDPRFGQDMPESTVRDLVVQLPAGFVGTAVGIPTCPTARFVELVVNPIAASQSIPNCPDSTAIGGANTRLSAGYFMSPVYNLVPPPGVAVKMGYRVFNTPVVLEIGVNQSRPYNVVSGLITIPQTSPVFRGFLELWGVPGSPVHDPYRGKCLNYDPEFNLEKFSSQGICPTNAPEVPLFSLPASCQGPLTTSYATDSWANAGAHLPDGEPDLSDPRWVTGSVLSTDESTPPNPQGMTGCDKLGFTPTIEAKPTTKAAQSPSGLDFGLSVHDEGLMNPTGLSQSTIRKAEVTLPEGFTTNPSLAEGLATCSEADLARETLHSDPGAGCPNASKIGTVEVETPLLGESVDGSLFIATPYENEVGSLIGLYLVIKNPKLGIMIKQPLKVENDPVTGRITTVAEELPQLPYSHFKLHFREGTRSPLASPPICGTFDTTAVLTPWNGAPPVTSTDMFQLISGPGGGPCPSGDTPPFHPGLEAGSVNNAAGRHSPFYVHLSRNDGEQEITHFSIKLPPGITGKLAGIPFCSDADIAAAAAKTGPNGGQEEIDHPSCPAASEVGHTLVGAGVGPSPAYVPGKLYLAGPYNGSPISIVAITAAKAGPFDLGTVVVREALRINPETAEVFIDATGSDPLPHIIKGIPVHLRDIQAFVDRPDFVLNPTNCAPTSTASTVLGSGTNFASEADDQPITVASRFQAADCASLEYKPRLSLKLRGGTKRGGNPALTATLLPRPGDANSRKVSVALPHSEFLDQAHIKTICTRVQFKAGAGNGAECPAASVYGKAKAWTPLLSEPLEGPIFLRSSEHPLPDLVLALHGLVDFTAVGRIDSVNGGIRNTFEAVPDAPITKVEVMFPGGKKSLLENSTNICLGKHNANVEFAAQSGKESEARVALKPQCKGKGRKHKKAKKGHRGARVSSFGRLYRAW